MAMFNSYVSLPQGIVLKLISKLSWLVFRRRTPPDPSSSVGFTCYATKTIPKSSA